MSGQVPERQRYHRIDGWRGYPIPRLAVIGASDTGTWSDSPAPTPEVKAELAAFQRDVLRPAGIRSRTRFGHTSNVFAGKRWLTVAERDYARAAQLAVDWEAENNHRLRYVHTADLEAVGYRPSAE